MSPADEAKLAALKALEGDLEDALRMADIAADLAHDAFVNRELHRQVAGGKPDMYFLPSAQVERIIFACQLTHDMAQRLNDRFLSILEGPREAGEEVPS